VTEHVFYNKRQKVAHTFRARARSERFVLTITRGAKSATLGALGLWVSVEQCSAPVWPRCSSLGFSRAMVRDASKQASSQGSSPVATVCDCSRWSALPQMAPTPLLMQRAHALCNIYVHTWWCVSYTSAEFLPPAARARVNIYIPHSGVFVYHLFVITKESVAWDSGIYLSAAPSEQCTFGVVILKTTSSELMWHCASQCVPHQRNDAYYSNGGPAIQCNLC